MGGLGGRGVAGDFCDGRKIAWAIFYMDYRLSVVGSFA